MTTHLTNVKSFILVNCLFRYFYSNYNDSPVSRLNITPPRHMTIINTSVKCQKAITAYLKSKYLLPFDFVRRNTYHVAVLILFICHYTSPPIMLYRSGQIVGCAIQMIDTYDTLAARVELLLKQKTGKKKGFFVKNTMKSINNNFVMLR